ncbi:MAG: YlbF family regulator [Candidatus Palauibacterales bacterium]|nr:YlbF family regulator [Candidatus Palauibacterales bacterium]
MQRGRERPRDRDSGEIGIVMADTDRIFERASEVGRLISQTPEYAYLRAAMRDIEGDEEARGRLDAIRGLQEKLIGFLEKEEEPPEDLRHDLGRLSEEMQTSTRYQALISAQANFDKLMDRVNQSIAEGVKAGEQSRIILPS